DAWPTWVDPAPTDEKERWEIAVQQQDAGVSFQEAMRGMGKDQADIDRILTEKAGEAANVGRVAVEAFRQGQDPAAALRG
ncbi:MAG TPA: hypothetical protein VK053_24100, partial [Jiangellaceae bacterium]|nr:hypothetical protein [Jiangellaceae bacterium]